MSEYKARFQEGQLLQVDEGPGRRFVFARQVSSFRVSRRNNPTRRPAWTSQKGFRMESEVFTVGSRVQLLSCGPLKGRRGMIQTVHCLPPLEKPCCFSATGT
jgi:hypothetical protein